MSNNIFKVIDFFCGAGGWSEGFRQQGFKVVKGIDNWRPAVETHNLNHGLRDAPMDILDYEKCPVEKIDADFEDVEIIVGSPPCVSFSMSNKAGKADKSLGKSLIETYLRIVAYKKHKHGSKLVAWYMENVPNSRNYVKEHYTFKDLGLGPWAKKNKKKPNAVALKVKNNGDVLCAADFGSPQSRDRFVCGEWVKDGEFPAPAKTHDGRHVTLGRVLSNMPSPASKVGKTFCADPNYPFLKLALNEVTDHFYDTGVYEVEWESSRAAKVNHPFMGRMSFPENRERPSRTIMATRSASTREALLYPSEYGRKGDGEFRMPTIREAASLMGFPLTYQFTGGEGTKWKQIGNAVCPHMSIAIAKEIRRRTGLKAIPSAKVKFPRTKNPNDLNTYVQKSFSNPPQKTSVTKFRRQPFKFGGLAIALVNHDPLGRDSRWKPGSKWAASLIIGSGKDFSVQPLGEREQTLLVRTLEASPKASIFIRAFEKEYAGRIGTHEQLQRMLIEHRDDGSLLKPTSLVDSIGRFVEAHANGDETVPSSAELKKLTGKDAVPLRHLFAAYAIASVAKGGNLVSKKVATR